MLSASHLRGCLTEIMGREAQRAVIVPIRRGRCYRVHQGHLRYVVKIYTNNEKLRIDICAASLARKCSPLLAPTILEVNKSRNIIIWEEIQGHPFGHWLRTNAQPQLAYKVAETVGRNLQLLHTVQPEASSIIPELDVQLGLAFEIQRLRAILQSLSQHRRDGQQLRRRCENTLRAQHECLSKLSWEAERLLEESSKTFLAATDTLVHGDLWSENILISKASSKIHVTFVDFEWARRSHPLVDIARAYCRGFVVRNLRRPFVIGTTHDLWTSFARGYRSSQDTDTTNVVFGIAAAYGFIRTINHYAEQLSRTRSARKASAAVKTIDRIANACVKYFRCFSD